MNLLLVVVLGNRDKSRPVLIGLNLVIDTVNSGETARLHDSVSRKLDLNFSNKIVRMFYRNGTVSLNPKLLEKEKAVAAIEYMTVIPFQDEDCKDESLPQKIPEDLSQFFGRYFFEQEIFSDNSGFSWKVVGLYEYF